MKCFQQITVWLLVNIINQNTNVLSQFISNEKYILKPQYKICRQKIGKIIVVYNDMNEGLKVTNSCFIIDRCLSTKQNSKRSLTHIAINILQTICHFTK